MRLIARDLTCDRGGRRVLDGVDFDVGAGEALVITGPNGAGKSTLLRLVAGFLRRAGGDLRLEGGAEEADIPEQAHYLGHADALKAAFTLRETLETWARILGGGTERVVDALEEVGLDHLADLPAAYLSAGQRRRLGLARLVAIERPIWLLDEPTTAIDAASETRLVQSIEAHLARGGLILTATHAPLGLGRAKSLVLGSG